MIPLSQIIEDGRPCDLDRALKLSAALAGALARLHASGCSPASFDPSAIVWDEGEMAEFVLIKEWRGDAGGAVAPSSGDVVSGGDLDLDPAAQAQAAARTQADLADLGRLLFRILTGHTWEPGAPQPRRLNTHIPIKLQICVLRALGDPTTGTCASAAAMLEELRQVGRRPQAFYTAKPGGPRPSDLAQRLLEANRLPALKGTKEERQAAAVAAPADPAPAGAATAGPAPAGPATAGPPLPPSSRPIPAFLRQLAFLIPALAVIAIAAGVLGGFISVGPPPNRGELTVYSIPSAARVFVDQAYIGQTPISRRQLAPGDHLILIKAENYYDYQSTYKLEAGKETVVSAGLAPMPGSIMVQSEPSGAQIFLDGILLKDQLTPFLVADVPAGQHKVKLRKAGHEDLESTVTVKPHDQTLLVRALTAIRATGSPGGPVEEEPIEVGYNETRGPGFQPYELRANTTKRFPVSQAKNIGFRILSTSFGLERGTVVPSLIWAQYPDGTRNRIWDMEYAMDSVRFLDGGGVFQVVPGVYTIYAQLTIGGRTRTISTKVVVETD